MSVFLVGVATMKTDPPPPPLPPSGPPRGTYFSRRKLRQPLPPLPAATWMSTSSTNIFNSMGDQLPIPNFQLPRSLAPRKRASWELGVGGWEWLLDWNDRDSAAVPAVIFEADLAANFRKERVILAEADVQTRIEP